MYPNNSTHLHPLIVIWNFYGLKPLITRLFFLLWWKDMNWINTSMAICCVHLMQHRTHVFVLCFSIFCMIIWFNRTCSVSTLKEKINVMCCKRSHGIAIILRVHMRVNLLDISVDNYNFPRLLFLLWRLKQHDSWTCTFCKFIIGLPNKEASLGYVKQNQCFSMSTLLAI